MNAKQTAPLLVTLAPLAAIAPPILIGSAIGLGVVLLIKSLMDSDADKKPETTSPDADSGRKEPETVAFRTIPAVAPASAPVRAELETTRKTVEFVRNEAEKPAFREIPVVPSVPLDNVSPVSLVRPASAVVVAVQPVAKKAITRADMAAIFEAGKRPLSRLDAVAALKQLGFGKTAAYAATAPDGRFSAWLVFSSDGIIYWMDEN